MRAQEFRGLAVLPLERDPRLNPVTHRGLDSVLGGGLSEHFAESNERLYRLLGRGLGWR